MHRMVGQPRMTLERNAAREQDDTAVRDFGGRPEKSVLWGFKSKVTSITDLAFGVEPVGVVLEGVGGEGCG
ncbi:hypothetical protein, partial [Actinomadura sp. 6K520]|uniref:hypothetical protein n=1 Tax=Actinomadura sp. 6K520 TaxID=2530364 RepID=UPI001FB653F8